MIGYIYKITNDINNKVYIGQTKTSIKKRWNAHLTRYNSKNNQGIYGAMKKYGIDHFKIEKIVECPIEELNDLEQFYIKKYNSYYEGYNLTLGGDGTQTIDLDEEKVIKKYKECGFITDTAKFFNCCEPIISNILHKNNIKIKTKAKFDITSIPKEQQIKHGHETGCKKVEIIELEKQFNSIIECGKWLIDNNYCNTQKPELAQRSISRVLNGDRKTYCKLHFKFI